MQFPVTSDSQPFFAKCKTRARLPMVLLLPAIMIAGCSEPTEGIVRGTVTVDGTLAKTGAITFIPEDGQSGTSGAVIRDGKYAATDVPPGSHKVQVRVSKAVGQQKLYDSPDSEVKQVMAEILPAKFNNETELRLEVKVGENEKNYDLSTK